MGKPVAFEASADERDTRGFISMIDPPPGGGVHRELHVGAARLHADPAQAGEGVVAHGLVLDVGQRLGRRHGDGVAGVHAHGVEVLDGADDDAVVRRVAHHLELELLPAGDRLLDQDLADRAGRQPLAGQPAELRRVLGDARALAAEDEARAHHDGEADLLGDLLGLGRASGRSPTRGTSRPMLSMAALNWSRSSAVAIASGRAPMTSTP